MKRSLAVNIAGQRYVLRSDEDDHYVRRLAGLVDERFRKIERSTRQVSTHAIAMLTALQLADEFLKEKQRRADLREEVRERSQRMLRLISRHIEK